MTTSQQQQHQRPAHSGVKRHASDSLENEQRLSKRLERLDLGMSTPLPLPAFYSISLTHGPLPERSIHRPRHLPTYDSWSRRNEPTLPVTGAAVTDDTMQVDETKDRIFISNLDDELSDGESAEEDELIILPGVEKRMTRIPSSVLAHDDHSSRPSTELVLYRIPTSLSIPEAEDSVRRVILESRARARAKDGQFQFRFPGAETNDLRVESQEIDWGGREDPIGMTGDPDAMDIENWDA